MSESSREKLRERFFPKSVQINIDGICESYEMIEGKFGEDTVVIRYKLRGKEVYKTQV